MIHIRIKRKKGKICEMEVSGHALFDQYGKDIVCAGVSAINFGGLNAVAHYFNNDLSSFEVEITDGKTLLTINNLNENRVQTVLETLVIQFKTIEETYSKYIHISEQEVQAQ